MAQDEPPAEEPTTGERTQTERLASAAERAKIETEATDESDKAPDTDDEADKTDMAAVGDDGQVFGG